MNEAIKMQLSAFVDGELPENESELLLRRLSQDAELRHHVSEYLAIGRVMRGEPQVSGIDQLRDRIRVALDDGEAMDDIVVDEPSAGGFARPLTGFAVAATVAVVALFGFRQFAGDEVAPEIGDAPAMAITQPEPDTLLDQYRQSHGDITEAEAGAAAIADRLINVAEPRAVEYVEIPAGDVADDEGEDDAEDSEAEAATDTAAE